MKSIPDFLLKGILWSFDGTKYNTQSEFENALETYCSDLGIEVPASKEIPLKEIEILLEYIDEEDEDQEVEFTVKSENGAYLTEKELLYKINKKVTGKLADLDKHFFEGLSLLEEKDPPLYCIDVGS